MRFSQKYKKKFKIFGNEKVLKVFNSQKWGKKNSENHQIFILFLFFQRVAKNARNMMEDFYFLGFIARFG